MRSFLSLPAQRSGNGGAPVSCGHAAAVVGGDVELLDVALPFLDAGLRNGDLVALNCLPGTVELITSELGERAAAVESEPRLSLLGSRAPDALAMAGRFLDRAAASGSGRLRVLSEIDFGAEPAGWREGLRFEAAFNRLMGGVPVDVICTYDRRRLPEPVVESAAATHPVLVGAAGPRANPGFQDPDDFVRSLPLPREPVEDDEPAFAVDDAGTLAGLRHQLHDVIAALVPRRDQQEDLHLAASEIAANAFRHGVPPVSARVWGDGTHVVCVIADRGTSYGDPFSGFLPAHGADLSRGGMGLWLARKLWDHVDVLPGPTGLSVRLSSRIR
ncbi:sensor histidine kinase [Blastococcus tunisiensis]|uniref:Anti-sigma regulatory factor (Ser/Thr protein kinase) n=1 Tax=Blastococcus tunisiensis TaxID=1798228 RepID=A0A1I2FCL6_9ACTN|nr:sensor histidine kinase [Blastococcus sp. DSM 46838]SFF02639.1 Anti-sigma regulatory factor (Ser/Thr protein kinase) [Blastococcus sp. DSM 46838]